MSIILHFMCEMFKAGLRFGYALVAFIYSILSSIFEKSLNLLSDSGFLFFRNFHLARPLNGGCFGFAMRKAVYMRKQNYMFLVYDLVMRLRAFYADRSGYGYLNPINALLVNYSEG
jgi:hypothetical protein